MTMRQMHPSRMEHQRDPEGFDPIAEGGRYRLPRELSLALWEGVRAEVRDTAGQVDVDHSRRRFQEVAARIAAHGGRLRPDIGRVTRVEAEIQGMSLDAWSVDDLTPRVPGRRTLVSTEADEPGVRADAAGHAQSASLPLTPLAALLGGGQPSALDRVLSRGLHEVLVALASLHGGRGLVEATLSAAITSRGQSAGSLLPRPPSPVGQAMWRVAERRAATLYRRELNEDTPRIADRAVEDALARIGSGQALPVSVRCAMEAELGASFDRVRVHTDAVASEAARAVHAPGRSRVARSRTGTCRPGLPGSHRAWPTRPASQSSRRLARARGRCDRPADRRRAIS